MQVGAIATVVPSAKPDARSLTKHIEFHIQREKIQINHSNRELILLSLESVDL